jgi:hypothetical protein
MEGKRGPGTESRRDECEEDDDVAWLLARAKGQPGPSISETSAARYEKIEALIADLPVARAGAAPREGWQDRVLAAIDDEDAGSAPPATRGRHALATRGRARWLVPIAAIAVAAAAIIAGTLWFGGRAPGVIAMAPVLEVNVDAAGSNLGAMAPAMIGDALVVRGAADGAAELRVYDDDGVELARCATPAQGCRVTRSGTRTRLQLTMTLRARGAVRPLLFAPPLGGPSAGLDLDLQAAGKADLEVVRSGPVIVP